MYYIIYITTNLVNKKQYVGKHISEKLEDDYFGSGLILKNAIKKNGKYKFKKEILELCESLNELNQKEIFWIANKNTLYPNGYNLTSGGSGGDTFTNSPYKERIKNNRSISLKRYWDSLSEEDKEFRLNLLRGKKRSEESKRKYSECKKGKKMSPEHLQNMINAVTKAKKGKLTYNHREVDMFDLDNNYIKSFITISAASKETGHSASIICKICKNNKAHVKNHIFKYKG